MSIDLYTIDVNIFRSMFNGYENDPGSNKYGEKPGVSYK